jgi:hypothetical protein
VSRLTYLVGEQVFWLVFRTGVNEARREVLGLPPLPLRAPFPEARRRGAPALYGYSPTVLPKPSDWPDWVRVTGYWFLDRTADWRPAPELVRFLESGPPPVYVGFGSMHARSAPSLTATVVEALRRTGQRGILLSGWGALTDTGLPDGITAVDSVPHDWLFPQTAAVVHHAGAGTTGAGLRAGVPTVAIPFFADQPFWARRVFDLGAGPRPIPLKRLTAERLAGAVQIAVQDESVRARAAEVGEAIRAEDGVAQAVEADPGPQSTIVSTMTRTHTGPSSASSGHSPSHTSCTDRHDPQSVAVQRPEDADAVPSRSQSGTRREDVEHGVGRERDHPGKQHPLVQRYPQLPDRDPPHQRQHANEHQ